MITERGLDCGRSFSARANRSAIGVNQLSPPIAPARKTVRRATCSQEPQALSLVVDMSGTRLVIPAEFRAVDQHPAEIFEFDFRNQHQEMCQLGRSRPTTEHH